MVVMLLCFFPDKLPEFIGWISVQGYETKDEVKFLEQSVFHQLNHKRLYKDRELFRDVSLEEITQCLRNLSLEPNISTEFLLIIRRKRTKENKFLRDLCQAFSETYSCSNEDLFRLK